MKPWLGEEEAAAAAEAVSSGWVAQGPRVARFEQAVAERVGAAHGVALTSCTTALHLALVVLGLGPGDEVVVPSLSFIATANAARYVGATPVFADVDAATQNLTPATIEAVLTPATRAVVVVHQGGCPADLDAIHALCGPRGVAVVEDAACAIGATYRGAPIGGRSDLVAFSFHPRKVITTGEGGMLMTSRPDWAERLRRLREHGMNLSAAARHQATTVAIERYLETGYNYRMTDIQAAVGLVQLAKLEAIVERRRALAERYRQLLGDVPGLAMASDPSYGTSNFQSFWVVLPDDFPLSRSDLMAGLLAEGVSSRRGIMASHLEPAYEGHPHGPLPVTEHLDRQALILPMFHAMTEEEQDRVAAVVRSAAGLIPSTL
ncbi:MAG TPA: DegT/DnrJ/EryC1/StrS family aminotransferase [Acidimicrobiales bacterium]|nr:DegT/DnrJ/EryC1/StrS family aminotransferase [Acidimicrobiales bacterium]